MRITCPQCGFFRELPDNKVPVTSTMATCPKCRHRFKFRPDTTTGSRAASREPVRPAVAPSQSDDAASSWRRPGHAARRDAPQADPRRALLDVREALDEEDLEPPRRPRDPEPAAPSRPAPAPRDPDLFEDSRPGDAPDSRRAVPRSEDGPEAGHPAAERYGRDAAETPAADWREEGFRHALDNARDPEDASGLDTRDETLPRNASAAHAPSVAARRTEPPRSRPVPEAETVPPDEDAAAGADAASEMYDAPPVRRSVPRDTAHEGPDQPDSGPVSLTPDAGDAAETRPGRSDGVRDIWARLQAMNDEPRRKAAPAQGRATPEDGPDEPESPRETVTDPIPWERLDAYGFFPGLFLTLKKILLAPTAFFSAMPEGRPKAKALVFNLLISEFLLVIDFLWSLTGLRARLGDTGEAAGLSAIAHAPGLGFLVALLLVPLAIALGIYLDAWLTHLLLLLFRSAKKGFNETFRVMCYSAAPTVLSAVPVAGQILSPVILVWYMALQAIGLKKVHEGAYTQTLAAIFIKWSLYLFLLLAMLQNLAPGS